LLQCFDRLSGLFTIDEDTLCQTQERGHNQESEDQFPRPLQIIVAVADHDEPESGADTRTVKNVVAVHCLDILDFTMRSQEDEFLTPPIEVRQTERNQ